MNSHFRLHSEYRNDDADNNNHKRQRPAERPAEYIILNPGGTLEATRLITYIIENCNTRCLPLR